MSCAVALVASALAAQGATLEGRVILPQELRERWSIVLSVKVSDPFDEDALQIHETPINAAGRFSLTNLPAGEAMLLVVDAEGRTRHEIEGLRLDGEEPVDDPRLHAIDWTAWRPWTFRCLSPQNLPIDGARVIRSVVVNGTTRGVPATRVHRGAAECWLPPGPAVLAVLNPGYRETVVYAWRDCEPVILLPRPRVMLRIDGLDESPAGSEIAVACRESLLADADWECLGVLRGCGRAVIAPPRDGRVVLRLVPRRIGAPLCVEGGAELVVKVPSAGGVLVQPLDDRARRQLAERFAAIASK